MFKRTVEAKIQAYLQIKGQSNPKILFIWGPRRSGKTTILQKTGRAINAPIFNFDFVSDQEKFPARRAELENIAREEKVILIDEVQNFPEATVALKLLHDEFGVKIIATGSSELRAKSKTFDSLAGRFEEIFCLPLSFAELIDNAALKSHAQAEFLKEQIEKTQIFGSYPEVELAKNESEKQELLQNLLNTFVLKDIVNLYELKNMKLALDILTKIALQIGQEVSLRELAVSLGANVATVTSYVEIFIKNYILIPLPSFKTNLRKAVSENRKLYFYDLGLRNILVRDFRKTALRPDAGHLFENLVVSEFEKARKNREAQLNIYFYREYGGREIDLVLEDYQKKYQCFEIKREKGRAAKIFPLPHRAEVISGANFYDLLQKTF